MHKLKLKVDVLVIALFIVIIPIVNFSHHKWKGKEGVIEWDVKHYYAYLPAAIIHHDLSLDFMDQDWKRYNKWIWPIETPTGKRAIVTTMGLSFLYSPFFFIAHAYASIDANYEADGYTMPYHVALAFSGFFYFILGLFYLRRLLRKYFSVGVVATTLLAIGLGTNLFYYVTYASAMSHGFNFVIFSTLIYFLDKWHDKQTLGSSIKIGLLAGLISLIRPTNALLLILIPLWKVNSLKSFTEKIRLLLKQWRLIVCMAVCFFIIWMPQFAYWKYISGHFLYFSYGEKNAHFFFNNPQIWNILFSYKKGWFVYTPLMLFATVSIILLFKQRFKLGLAISVYWLLVVFTLSSWWCWWFGGSFGQRSMVDFYGLMALPLAAGIEWAWNKKFLAKISTTILIISLIGLNILNTVQYNNMAIHFWWMNKEAYWTNFLKPKPSCKYWDVIMIPNYDLAREGIYEWKAAHIKQAVITDEMIKKEIIETNQGIIKEVVTEEFFTNQNMNGDSLLSLYADQLIDKGEAECYYDDLKIDYYIRKINACKDWKKKMIRKARRKEITVDEMINIEAHRVYQSYGKKYAER